MREMDPSNPPRWLKGLMKLILRADYLEEIEGDMEEVYADNLELFSRRKANWLFLQDVFRLFRPSLLKNTKWILKINFIAMTLSNLKIAFRTLLKFKGHSAINLTGLSLGIAIGGLVLLYVTDELSFDTFHTKSDRVFKVVTASAEADGGMETNAHPIGHHLRNDFPEVESVLYIRNASSTLKLNHKDKRYEQDILYASPEFFDLFSFQLLKGDPREALVDPYSIVVTKNVEDTYFDGDAVGKKLTLRDTMDFKITGVLQDVPANSHIQFDMLMSFSTFPKHRWFSYTEGWGNFDVRNYILLKEGIDPEEFRKKISGLYNQHVGDWFEEMGVDFYSDIIPMGEVYLGERFGNGMGPNGSMKRVKTIAIIAVFLIVLACINYINLSTARSAYRAKEVGMRKVTGSSRMAIVSQFMMESFLLTVVAFIAAIFFIAMILPFFNEIMLKKYTLVSFMTPQVLSGVAILILLITLLSGYYPAWVISGWKPLNALSGKLGKTYQGLSLRKALITFQFFISSSLVLATLLVINQITFMQTQELGFDKEQLLIIDATNAPRNSARQVLKNELISLPGVHSVSQTNALPGRPGWQGQWAYPEKIGDEYVETEYMAIDEHYIDALGLELIAGRNFELERTSELKDGLVINESCVEAMGWTSADDAIGKRIVSPSGQPEGVVIGVVKDYHGLGLQDRIWAKAMDYTGQDFGRYYAVKYDVEQTYDLVKSIQKTWDATFKSYPLEYFFLDEDFDRQYREENQLARVLSIFAVIVIIVSAIGLLGLISFVALSRTKEVGIRKTLGASVGQITFILSREFILLVLLGNVLAIPLIWYYGNQWLNDFAYHTTINPVIFGIAILFTALIAFITVSFQTIKTARMNPVLALRYE